MAGVVLGNEHTRRVSRDLIAFMGYCDHYGVQAIGATRPAIDAYARALDAEGLAPSTIARSLSALASVYAYLEEEDVIASSPVQRVRRPRVAQESPTLGLDRGEAVALLAAAADAGPRDDALLALLLLNGLRVSEALGLADLDTERGREPRSRRFGPPCAASGFRWNRLLSRLR